ncbi:MAG: GntR family transcriptional regulator [Candidatus Azotimanducaceae bacterium]|jgi:GntR family transcriptional regulator
MLSVNGLPVFRISCTLTSNGTCNNQSMEIVINLESDEPLFEQLVFQIKEAVKTSDLKPGDSLPSIRQLAGDLQLNNKTVAKAYRLLERDTVIQAKGYRGTFVHPEAVANSMKDLKSLVSQQMGKTIQSLRSSGATDSEIRIAFSELMKSH